VHNNNENTILVTGATGLVGIHLVKALVCQGKKVKALYRSAVPHFEDAEKAVWVKADILDLPSLEDAMEDVAQVYHCAAIVSFNPREKKLLEKTNIEGTANVVNLSLDHNIEKLLHVSSVSALGRIRRNEVITEAMKWSEETNNSEYGRTKYLAEMEVWRGIGEGLDAVIVNPTIILGLTDWNRGSAAIFRSVYNEFPWYTEGVTGFVDVADVVKAMILLMDSDVSGERFIINGVNMHYREMFALIAKSFGRKPPYKKVTPVVAEIVWRLESFRNALSGRQPLVTRETARTAQATVYFDNSKLLQFFPQFRYTPVEDTVSRICHGFKKMYGLV
jgi:nucleoside-diphosphate-sugar epimerase